MKLRLSATLALLLLLNISYAQSPVNSEKKKEIPKELSLEEKMEGTYQIIITDSKITEAFTTDLLPIIESKRHDTEDVYYEISKYTTIRIYSRAKINSPEFKTKKK